MSKTSSPNGRIRKHQGGHWQSRDAYQVQSFLYGLLAIALFSEAFYVLSTGRWGNGGILVGGILITMRRALLWLGRWALHGVLFAFMALGSSGCALWFQQTHPPIQRTMMVPEAPDAAFRRALLVTTDLGCTLWTQDRQTRTLQAFYRTETQLTVTVQPKARGSELQVVHHNLPTYFGQGNDGALSDIFLSRYAQSLGAQGK